MRKELSKKEIGNRNLKLSMEFGRYIMEHPEITDKIPQNSAVIILPQDDPELCEINRKEAEDRIKKGEQVVFVNIKKIRLQFEGISFENEPIEKAVAV